MPTEYVIYLLGDAEEFVEDCSDGDEYTDDYSDGESSEYQIVNDFDVTPYTGDYTVVPKAHSEQVLETAGKLMLDDVTVTKIPYYEVSNVKDGLTIYIAGEVEING